MVSVLDRSNRVKKPPESIIAGCTVDGVRKKHLPLMEELFFTYWMVKHKDTFPDEKEHKAYLTDRWERMLEEINMRAGHAGHTKS